MSLSARVPGNSGVASAFAFERWERLGVVSSAPAVHIHVFRGQMLWGESPFCFDLAEV